MATPKKNEKALNVIIPEDVYNEWRGLIPEGFILKYALIEAIKHDITRRKELQSKKEEEE